MSDVYVVRDGDRIVGVSARLQGAELIRAKRAELVARSEGGGIAWENSVYKSVYSRMRIENHELRDE